MTARQFINSMFYKSMCKTTQLCRNFSPSSDSNDHEPIHVHVVKGGAEARFQVQPEIALIDNKGLKPAAAQPRRNPFCDSEPRARRLNYGGVNDFPPLREGEVESRRPWEDRRGAGLGGSRRRSSGLRRPRARTPAMDGTGALA